MSARARRDHPEKATRMKLTIDIFIQLKKANGSLVAFNLCEDGPFQEWKHEFGYPERFHSLKFANGIEWDETYGSRHVLSTLSFP